MFDVKRWNGTNWYNSLCSPYKTRAEAFQHIKQYSPWHYNKNYPARIVKRGEPIEDDIPTVKIKLI